jgi:hypothetical protein
MTDEWDTYEAERAAAWNELFTDAPTCPACGATASAKFLETTSVGRKPSFVRAGKWSCSAACWNKDPQRYLDAVRAQS